MVIVVKPVCSVCNSKEWKAKNDYKEPPLNSNNDFKNTLDEEIKKLKDGGK